MPINILFNYIAGYNERRVMMIQKMAIGATIENGEKNHFSDGILFLFNVN